MALVLKSIAPMASGLPSLEIICDFQDAEVRHGTSPRLVYATMEISTIAPNDPFYLGTVPSLAQSNFNYMRFRVPLGHDGIATIERVRKRDDVMMMAQVYVQFLYLPGAPAKPMEFISTFANVQMPDGATGIKIPESEWTKKFLSAWGRRAVVVGIEDPELVSMLREEAQRLALSEGEIVERALKERYSKAPADTE